MWRAASSRNSPQQPPRGRRRGVVRRVAGALVVMSLTGAALAVGTFRWMAARRRPPTGDHRAERLGPGVRRGQDRRLSLGRRGCGDRRLDVRPRSVHGRRHRAARCCSRLAGRPVGDEDPHLLQRHPGRVRLAGAPERGERCARPGMGRWCPRRRRKPARPRLRLLPQVRRPVPLEGGHRAHPVGVARCLSEDRDRWQRRGHRGQQRGLHLCC